MRAPTSISKRSCAPGLAREEEHRPTESAHEPLGVQRGEVGKVGPVYLVRDEHGLAEDGNQHPK
jgi:hypothetical protein